MATGTVQKIEVADDSGAAIVMVEGFGATVMLKLSGELDNDFINVMLDISPELWAKMSRSKPYEYYKAEFDNWRTIYEADAS